MKKNYTLYTFILFLTLSFIGTNTASAQAPLIGLIQGPAVVCSSPASPIIYSVQASNSPLAYSWSYAGPSGVVISNPSGSVTPISFPYNSVTNTTFTLYCYASNNSGTSSTTSFVVKIYETPSVTFSGSNFFCQGSSTNIMASPTILSSSSTLSYNWSPSTGLNTTNGPMVTAQPPATTNYTVLLTLGNSAGSCTNTAQLTIVTTTCVVGINAFSSKEFDLLLVYPNPSTDFFILKSNKNELATILNEIGQAVRSFNLVAGTETKISGLPGGIYFVITPNSRKKIIVTN